MIFFAFQGNKLRTKLTREKFEFISEDLVDRTMLTCAKVLREANVEARRRRIREAARRLIEGGGLAALTMRKLAKVAGWGPPGDIDALKEMFEVGYDGDTTWTQDGIMPREEADAYWASAFGFGIIRRALGDVLLFWRRTWRLCRKRRSPTRQRPDLDGDDSAIGDT